MNTDILKRVYGHLGTARDRIDSLEAEVFTLNEKVEGLIKLVEEYNSTPVMVGIDPAAPDKESYTGGDK